MTFKGLTIRMDSLLNVTETRSNHSNGHSTTYATRAPDDKEIDSLLLEDTLRQFPECTCENYGLIPGITVGELQGLGAGCTGSQVRIIRDEKGERHWVNQAGPGWVCPRLLKIRARMGR